jgi:hypothetical protein
MGLMRFLETINRVLVSVGVLILHFNQSIEMSFVFFQRGSLASLYHFYII